ncbi:hypothetical protein KIW84_056106 [Lathyrus oleraceus]|uniref:Uncharacterized protein n=1 Tax=Pisum sativum TaxID=3888 RepID=A0A9D4WZL4_PEA|nr:hypothetical protein KIW84_056106 [Pisum sativum]
MDTTQLIYLIMSGKRIDVAQIIVNEMRNVAGSVQIPNVVSFEIKTKVNGTYVDRFCLEKKKKRRQPGQTGQTSSNTLNYGDWDPRLRQAFTYK